VPAALQVVEVDLADPVGAAGHGDDAGGGRRLQLLRQEAGEGEVAEVVGAELELEAVGGLATRRRHHARVVDQQIERLGAGGDRGRGGADRGEVGEVEGDQL